MPNSIALLATTVFALTCATLAGAQVSDSTFPLLDGKIAPLTLRLKDLDSNWRVFTASGGSYESILTAAMGGGAGSSVFTKGQTVTVGTDVFLVTYKADPPDMAAIFAGGGRPKLKAMTADTVLRLSLLNLHALSAMDGIRIFDLKEQLGTSSKAAAALEHLEKETTTTTTTTTSSSTKEPALLKTGSAAPDFVVIDAKGKPVKLSAYRGKVVVLDFWATWCGPCQESLPGTNEIAAKYAKKKVVFLGVNVWDTKQAFQGWLPDHKNLSSIKFLIDTHGQGQDVATKLYHVSGIPTQYVIDKKGRIIKSTVGYSQDESDLTKGINLALAKG